MSKSIPSGNVRTNNMLLEVTVPRRTGRKRKRGTAEPYRHEDNLCHVEPPGQALLEESHSKETASSSLAAKYLLRSLRDNDQDYSVQPVGTIQQTHRFRGRHPCYVPQLGLARWFTFMLLIGGWKLAMPDFVHSTANKGFVQKLRDYVLPFDCKTIVGRSSIYKLTRDLQMRPPRLLHST